ncbi:hypothetical protein C9374_006987 [Naegleria lovaniensis]|uniref:BRCT domain-containing protein n=1 Tax=Naegleria lovaniensis TaxID=51637 RepID=A0AA88KRP1_NAELO|nr:uncharacterized protein C9374_006987 [Naegleria lovaniensis]KAG2393456.1 hypothetical protein C9374_006987 [Naegleria lovaniensis]
MGNSGTKETASPSPSRSSKGRSSFANTSPKASTPSKEIVSLPKRISSHQSNTTTPLGSTKRKYEEVQVITSIHASQDTERDDDEEESTNIQNVVQESKKVKRESITNNSDHASSTATAPATVITFSGFKNTNDKFSKNVKKMLTDEAIKNNVIVKEESIDDRDTLSNDITHIIAPPYARTMKVLQAIATGRWIMSTKWITEGKCSLHNLHLFGVRRLDRPISGKKVFLHETFLKQHPTKTLTYKHCQMLVEFGSGDFTDKIEEADFCIVGGDENSADDKLVEEKERITQLYPYMMVLEWVELVDLIYPFYLEQALRKMEK